jgi:hypothetical protein
MQIHKLIRFGLLMVAILMAGLLSFCSSVSGLDPKPDFVLLEWVDLPQVVISDLDFGTGQHLVFSMRTQSYGQGEPYHQLMLETGEGEAEVLLTELEFDASWEMSGDCRYFFDIVDYQTSSSRLLIVKGLLTSQTEPPSYWIMEPPANYAPSSIAVRDNMLAVSYVDSIGRSIDSLVKVYEIGTWKELWSQSIPNGAVIAGWTPTELSLVIDLPEPSLFSQLRLETGDILIRSSSISLYVNTTRRFEREGFDTTRLRTCNLE